MVNTKVNPVAYGIDAQTPQAQRLEDVIASDPSKLRSSSATSLECKTYQVLAYSFHSSTQGHESDACYSNTRDRRR